MARQITIMLCFLWAGLACKKVVDKPADLLEGVIPHKGVFVINEGGFGYNNASLSYINFDTDEVSNQVYEARNGETVGDVFQSMIIVNEVAYLAVDNSDKLLVVQVETLEKIRAVTSVNGPRYLVYDEVNNLLWVSQYHAVNVVGISLSDFSIKHQINLPDYVVSGAVLPSGSDEMILEGNKLYVSNFRRPYAYVINTTTAELVDSFYVGYGVNNLMLHEQAIWAAGSGDAGLNEMATLSVYSIGNLNQLYIETSTQGFADLAWNPIKKEVMVQHGNSILAFAPETYKSHTLITATQGQNFYGMNVNQLNGDVWLTDALDYQQNGAVLKYNKDGELQNDYEVGLIPNNLVFY